MSIARRRERERILQDDYIKRNWYRTCSFLKQRLLIDGKLVEIYLHPIESVDHDHMEVAGLERDKLVFVKIAV